MTTTWQQFSAEVPAFAAAIRSRLEANRHHIIATVRENGAPRVSGIEVVFRGPHLTLGSMPGTAKARELRRDGRYALHAHPGDGSMEGGDAKIAGVAVEVADPGELAELMAADETSVPVELFRLELGEATLSSLDYELEAMIIETWHPGTGVVRYARYQDRPAERLEPD